MVEEYNHRDSSGVLLSKIETARSSIRTFKSVLLKADDMVSRPLLDM